MPLKRRVFGSSDALPSVGPFASLPKAKISDLASVNWTGGARSISGTLTNPTKYNRINMSGSNTIFSSGNAAIFIWCNVLNIISGSQSFVAYGSSGGAYDEGGFGGDGGSGGGAGDFPIKDGGTGGAGGGSGENGSDSAFFVGGAGYGLTYRGSFTWPSGGAGGAGGNGGGTPGIGGVGFGGGGIIYIASGSWSGASTFFLSGGGGGSSEDEVGLHDGDTGSSGSYALYKISGNSLTSKVVTDVW